MEPMDIVIENWKKRLLDLGKQNRLIHYKETKRSSLKIVSPDLDCLYDELVKEEKSFVFQTNTLHTPLEQETSVQKTKGLLEKKSELLIEEERNGKDTFLFIKTNKSITEQQQILKALKYKTRIAMEEQGIHTLFLTFGLLKWRENDAQDTYMYSPLVLVPVNLKLESLTAPYELCLTGEDLITNPTLCYKLEKEYGITLPAFQSEEQHVLDYLIEVNDLVARFQWDVELECSLNIFSYLKMNMYEDLTMNTEKIKNHPILKAFGGNLTEIQELSEDFNNVNHDEYQTPAQTYQVVDADASQQDALLYAKKGISFVLQGPPGTGKSQTITNIIAEALAENKKVLFVSEKMAALEVVYKRLSEVGLSEFCLPLHSHKANKKEVMDELNKTLQLDKVKVQQDVMYQLDVLESHRRKLNQYAEELHTVIEPLHQSIYEVNGRLSKLYLRPNVECDIKNVDKMTKEELNRYILALEEYEKALEKFDVPMEEHPWNGCKNLELSSDERGELTEIFGRLSPKIKNISECVEAIKEQYGVMVSSTFQGVHALLSIFQVAVKAPNIAKHWLSEDKLEEHIEIAKLHKGLQEEYLQLKDTIQQGFLINYEELDVEEAIQILSDTITEIKTVLSPENFYTNNHIILARNRIQSIVHDQKIVWKPFLSELEEVCHYLGIEPPRTLQETMQLKQLLELLYTNPIPTVQWFDSAKWKSNLNRCMEIRDVMLQINHKMLEITSDYDLDIIELNAAELLARFRNEYHGVYRLIRKEYRRDLEIIRSYLINQSIHFDEEEAIRVLTLVKEIRERTDWLNTKKDWLKRFLGKYYVEGDIDWEEIEEKLAHFKKILEYYRDAPVPKTVANLLMEGKMQEPLIKKMIVKISKLQKSQEFEQIQEVLKVDFNEMTLEEVLEQIQRAEELITIINQIYSLIKLDEHSKMPYSEGLSLLKKLKRFQYIEEILEEQRKHLKLKFPQDYLGLETDWDRILEGLAWIDEMNLLKKEYQFSKTFMEYCLETKKRNTMQETLEYMSWCLNEINEDVLAFMECFPEVELQEIKFYTLINRLEQICNKEYYYEQWVAYSEAKRHCMEMGLQNFIEEVEELQLNASLIVETFLKRFYHLWLEKMVPQFPALRTFQTSTREDTIQDFDKLDVTQFSIARTRIKERLLEHIPDFDTSSSGMDEVGILKRELSKKNRLLPLRKLFQVIPNLLLEVKPCFMMSPLCVSLFLKEEYYKFDLVIFDEASQIPTQDAIGAILRAKQVIIAGDSEQLPPTTFFQTTMGEVAQQDSEVEQENEKEIAESILEEAQTILPERTLRWHYRSRHESLINFSNERIYNYNLITFPSTIEYKQNYGVEMVYVENGRYDRGGKKCNSIEAKRVAELIFEELKRESGRSIGVITFSEAQQQEVEKKVREMRLEHPEFEEFFREDIQEPFFIKNLENVQGDERDTILFSIGYGKDENGVLRMNFGPLSRSGGYRRLNVAITRAKYNIKIVSSIQPEEMKIEEHTSEGVKMLQAYLSYARGQATLADQIEDSKEKRQEQVAQLAPFEQSVYEYLVSHNYQVATKVGSSGYRMDLAVIDTENPGQYIMGIECDGATYYAARTVRERERLRQNVLKEMGWKIYRVWSMDWMKNPFIEGQKMLEAIENITKEGKRVFDI